VRPRPHRGLAGRVLPGGGGDAHRARVEDRVACREVLADADRRRKYFAARNAILYARRHGRLAQRAKLAAFLAASLPLELLHHWTHGTDEQVWLKMRGIRDALADRRPPFEELGLR